MFYSLYNIIIQRIKYISVYFILCIIILFSVYFILCKYYSLYILFSVYIILKKKKKKERKKKKKKKKDSLNIISRLRKFPYCMEHIIILIIESVDSISRDEPDSPLKQYVTNAGISRARYTITHFKHHHSVLRLISNRMSAI